MIVMDVSCKISELIEAQKDYLRWKKHVKKKRRLKNDPDIFGSFKSAKVGARALLSDFSEEPNDSVITIFKTERNNFKIDAISNYNEFELHREEYGPKDVVAIVFFENEDPIVKRMQEFQT